MTTKRFELSFQAPKPNVADIRPVILGIFFFGAISFGLFMSAAIGRPPLIAVPDGKPFPLPWVWLLYSIAFISMCMAVAGLWAVFNYWWPRKPRKGELVITQDAFHLDQASGDLLTYHFEEIYSISTPYPKEMENWRDMHFYVESDKVGAGFHGRNFASREAFEEACDLIRSRIPPDNDPTELR